MEVSFEGPVESGIFREFGNFRISRGVQKKVKELSNEEIMETLTIFHSSWKNIWRTYLYINIFTSSPGLTY